MHSQLSQVTVVLVVAAIGLFTPTAGQINAYGCSSSGFSQRRLTNFGKYTFIMAPLAPNASNLQANMDCSITIIGYSTSRWIITIDSINIGAYQAEFNIYEGETTSGKNLLSLTNSSSVIRQFGINSGTFTARQTTSSGPAGLANGLRMTVEHLDTTDCPSGWYTVSSSSGYCYGVPKLAGNLTYDQSAKACNMMLANLVMGNFDYDSILSELLSAPISVVNPRLAYWVGMYMFDKSSEPKFLNKYTSLDSISGSMCTYSSSCQCIAYQSGRFYNDECTNRRQYICYMPRGGTSSYYDIASLIATASTIVTIIAIVLTVGFVLAVLISLIVVIVCCIRRNSVARRNRRQNADANAGALAATPANPYPTMPPPPPPQPEAPPYTISAPPYASTYSNLGFNAGAIGPAAEPGANVEKPPPYNPEWNGHQVPA